MLSEALWSNCYFGLWLGLGMPLFAIAPLHLDKTGFLFEILGYVPD